MQQRTRRQLWADRCATQSFVSAEGQLAPMAVLPPPHGPPQNDGYSGATAPPTPRQAQSAAVPAAAAPPCLCAATPLAATLARRAPPGQCRAGRSTSPPASSLEMMPLPPDPRPAGGGRSPLYTSTPRPSPSATAPSAPPLGPPGRHPLQQRQASLPPPTRSPPPPPPAPPPFPPPRLSLPPYSAATGSRRYANPNGSDSIGRPPAPGCVPSTPSIRSCLVPPRGRRSYRQGVPPRRCGRPVPYTQLPPPHQSPHHPRRQACRRGARFRL